MTFGEAMQPGMTSMEYLDIPHDERYEASRLVIDKRVYDRYDLSNINFSRWSVIRKLERKEKCDPADNEELVIYEL